MQIAEGKTYGGRYEGICLSSDPCALQKTTTSSYDVGMIAPPTDSYHCTIIPMVWYHNGMVP